MGGHEMAQSIHEVLEERGIHVPEHHKDMLLQQMQAFGQLRATVDQAALKDYDMALTHVPGGDRK
jgi:UDP-N-acetyl-D-mannosaminuronate dehydrogenase